MHAIFKVTPPPNCFHLRTPARGRGFPEAGWNLGTGAVEKGYLSVVESGERGRIKARGICLIWGFWVQFVHLDMSEQPPRLDPVNREIDSYS